MPPPQLLWWCRPYHAVSLYELQETDRLVKETIAAVDRHTTRLKINVSGQYFETRIGVLDRHPNTLLGDQRRRSQFFDRFKNELFFDRHRPSFEVVR